MSEKACKDCRFSELVRLGKNDLHKTRLCVWGPPQLAMMFQNTDAGQVPVMTAQWPQVQDNMWCHRFETSELPFQKHKGPHRTVPEGKMI